MTDTTYTIDTNTGPILTRQFSSVADAKAYVVRMCPMTERRGYTVNWTRSNGWYVMHVLNSKGREVHAAALRTGTLTRDSACTSQTHDHTDTMGADGIETALHPMTCHDCGLPTHYDSDTDNYVHDAMDAPGCFLIPERPADATSCI